MPGTTSLCYSPDDDGNRDNHEHFNKFTDGNIPEIPSTLNCRTCNRCGVTIINNTFKWSTGKEGCLRTLNNLVCKAANDPNCINPEKKDTYWLGYDTWEKRQKLSDAIKKYNLHTEDGLNSLVDKIIKKQDPFKNNDS